jgi:diguanylate cyclase (GGDEF)-like protein/PAS domain S-box-containing protein
MLGYTAEELTGLTWVQLTHPDDLAANLAQFNRLMAGEIDNYSMEKRFIRKDGEVIWTNLSVGCVRKPDGTVDYNVVQLHNISERKLVEAAESEQRALAEALRDTAAVLNSTLKFDDLLDRILDNVERVVPHDADAIGIFLLDAPSQRAQLVRYRNTRNSDHAVLMRNMQFPISQMHNLHEMQATGQSVIISETQGYPGWIVAPLSAWIRANLGVPITIKGETIGFLTLDSGTPNVFTARDAERLRAFVDQAAIAIENARLYAEVQELAITDVLTGLFNRRGLFQLGEREVERALRFQHALSVVMLDIDYFKRVNDSFGHPTGDRVLRALANCCRGLVRNVDVVARYGGEEFILLLPETDLASAAQVAERLRQSVEQMLVLADTGENGEGGPVQVTASLGVVGLTPETQNLVALLTRVDQALYAAKQAGRNRIAVRE